MAPSAELYLSSLTPEASGCSCVLFSDLALSEKQPTLATTCMDLQMLAHVRERTEAQWKKLLAKGVADSLIEAGLQAVPSGCETPSR